MSAVAAERRRGAAAGVLVMLVVLLCALLLAASAGSQSAFAQTSLKADGGVNGDALQADAEGGSLQQGGNAATAADAANAEAASQQQSMLVFAEGEDGGVSLVGYIAFTGASGKGGLLGTLNVPDVSAGLRTMSDDGAEYTYDVGANPDKNLVIPSTINGKPVTSIGPNAFEDAGWLETVTIPASVKQIGDEAFRGCSSLKSADLPSALTLLGSGAFRDCTSLESASIPAGCRLQSYAYYNCKKMTSLTIPEGVVGSYEYDNEEGTTYYEAYDAFADCDSLTEVSLPASLAGVHDSMFYSCDSLERVTLAEGITFIGSYAFEYCNKLSEFNLPSGLTRVGYCSFYGCTPSGTVVLPQALTEIESRAFYWYGYWYDEDDSADGASTIQAATWLQYWKLNGNSAYINTSSTTVLPPAGEEPTQVVFATKDAGDGKLVITGVESGTADELNIPAKIDGKDVVGIGDNAFEELSWVKTVVVQEGITTIGYNAFYSCRNLVSVSLPTSLGLIGDSAFQGCEKLASVSVPANCSLGSCAFYNCDGLTSVQLAEGVTLTTRDMYYDEYGGSVYSEYESGSVFWDCDSLSEIALPDSVTVIPESTFAYCYSLENITLGGSVAKIGSDAFTGCRPSRTFALPGSLTSIGENAFSWVGNGYYDDDDNYIAERSYSIQAATWEQYWQLQGNPRYIDTESTEVLPPATTQENGGFTTSENGDGTLTVTGYAAGSQPPSSLEIPSTIGDKSVAAIGDRAFQDATWIASLVVPSGVTSIGEDAFCGCSGLKSVELPSGLKELGDNSFRRCSSLEGVRVPAGCNLGSYVFSNCTSLASVELPEGVTCTSYDEDWDEKYTSTDIFLGCGTLAEVSLPASMKVVGSNMFIYCNNLSKVTLAEGISEINYSAFRYCYKLSSMNFPNSLTAVDAYAFSGCGLASIELPSGLKSVGEEAFRGCAPTNVITLPATLKSIGDKAFYFEGDGHWVEYYDEDGYWDERWVADGNRQIQTSTWAQYWKLQGNERYINVDATDVIPPVGVAASAVKFTFAINLDGSVTITGLEDAAPANLVIPSEIEVSPSVDTQGLMVQGLGVDELGFGLGVQASTKRTVTAIGEGAFKNVAGIQTVVLPDTLTTISDEAFAGCVNLETVYVPDSVTTIADSAFDTQESQGSGEDVTTLSFVCSDTSAASTYAATKNIQLSTALPLSMATVTTAERVTWTPDAIEPAVSVEFAGSQIDAGNYTVEYSSNSAARRYGVVTVTAAQGSGYEGQGYATFYIEPANLSGATIASVAKQEDAGNGVYPKPAVTMFGRKLVEGDDFEYEWSGNYGSGTGTVTATGIGNYTGTVSTQFSVVEKVNKTTKKVAVPAAKKLTYNGKAQVGVAAGTGYTVKNGSATNAGTYTATVTLASGYAWSDGTTAAKSVKYTIAKASQAIAAKSYSKTYKGKKLVKKGKLAKKQVIDLAKAAKVSAKTAVKYAKANKKGGNKIAVNAKTGKITVKKGLKKGTYKVAVKMTAAANANYNAAKAKTITVKVVVK